MRNGPTSNTNLSVDSFTRSTGITRTTGPTPGPRERAALAYLVRHGLEYGTRRGERVPRIPDDVTRIEGAPVAPVVLPVYGPNRADHTRCLSRLSSMGRTSVLPTFGAPRETISERTRRYDVDDRTSRDLEAQADALLRDAGFDVERVDVIDAWTRLPEVSPDSVAFRGAARFRPHAVHTSERAVTSDRIVTRADGKKVRRAGTPRGVWDTGVPGVQMVRPSVALARTTIVTRWETKVIDGQTTKVPTSKVTYLGCEGSGWQGRKIRHAVKVARPVGTAKRGPIGRTPWAMETKHVIQAWKKATDDQRARAIALRSALVADGQMTLTSGATLVIDGQSSTSQTTTDRTRVRVLIDDRPADRGFTLVDVVRRAVLAER